MGPRSSWSSSLFPGGRLGRHFYRREGERNAQGCTAGEVQAWPVKGVGLSPWRTTPNFSSSVLPGPPAACKCVHLPGPWPPEWDSLACTVPGGFLCRIVWKPLLWKAQEGVGSETESPLKAALQRWMGVTLAAWEAPRLSGRWAPAASGTGGPQAPGLGQELGCSLETF